MTSCLMPAPTDSRWGASSSPTRWTHELCRSTCRAASGRGGSSTSSKLVSERRASLPAIRQWPGVRQPRDSPLAAGGGIRTAYIEPGKPWQNGTAESLNSKFRDECLSMGGSAAAPGSGHHRNLASALQRGSAPFEPRVPPAPTKQFGQGRTQATSKHQPTEPASTNRCCPNNPGRSGNSSCRQEETLVSSLLTTVQVIDAFESLSQA